MISRSAEEKALTVNLANAYQLAQTEVMLALERAVCGSDYGGRGWASVSEADRLAGLLELAPGRHFLEIGAGSGWPALHMARHSGCDVTLTDVPFDGLPIALDRALTDGHEGRCLAAVADGAALPFAAGAFDAVHHSDVLCCLPSKRAVLGDCRRVIRAGGIMVFTVISITPGLSGADHERTVGDGPPFVATTLDYPEMLRRTGWKILRREDMGEGYMAMARRIKREGKARAPAMRRELGETWVDEYLENDRRRTGAVLDGRLSRHLYVATPVEG